MIYVSQDVRRLYLSFDTILELGIGNRDFPAVEQFSASPNRHLTARKAHSVAEICGTTRDDGAICDCSRRSCVPERPLSLSFKCVPKNITKMKEWLLRRYESSAFNTCPHQSLPEMTGLPVEIHIKDGTKPIACHKPASISIHWLNQVRSDFERDENLGVMERVPIRAG